MNAIGTVKVAIKNDNGLFLKADLLAGEDAELGEVFSVEISSGKLEFEAVEVEYGSYGKELMVKLMDIRKVVIVNAQELIERTLCR